MENHRRFWEFWKIDKPSIQQQSLAFRELIKIEEIENVPKINSIIYYEKLKDAFTPKFLIILLVYLMISIFGIIGLINLFTDTNDPSLLILLISFVAYVCFIVFGLLILYLELTKISGTLDILIVFSDESELNYSLPIIKKFYEILGFHTAKGYFEGYDARIKYFTYRNELLIALISEYRNLSTIASYTINSFHKYLTKFSSSLENSDEESSNSSIDVDTEINYADSDNNNDSKTPNDFEWIIPDKLSLSKKEGNELFNQFMNQKIMIGTIGFMLIMIAYIFNSYSFLAFTFILIFGTYIFLKYFYQRNKITISINYILQNDNYIENVYCQIKFRELLAFLGVHPKFQKRYFMNGRTFEWSDMSLPHYIPSDSVSLKIILDITESHTYDLIRENISQFKIIERSELFYKFTGIKDVVDINKREAEDEERYKKTVKLNETGLINFALILFILVIGLLILSLTVNTPYVDTGSELYSYNYYNDQHEGINSTSLDYIIAKDGLYLIKFNVLNTSTNHINYNVSYRLNGNEIFEQDGNRTYSKNTISLDNKFYLHKNDQLTISFTSSHDISIQINENIVLPEWIYGSISVPIQFVIYTMLILLISYGLVKPKFAEYKFTIDYYQDDSTINRDRIDVRNTKKNKIFVVLTAYYLFLYLIFQILLNSNIDFIFGLQYYQFGSLSAFSAHFFIFLQIIPVIILKSRINIEIKDGKYIFVFILLLIITFQASIFVGFRWLLIETWKWLI